MMTERKTRGARSFCLPALAVLLPVLALLLSFSARAAEPVPETAENGELFYQYMLSLAGDGTRAELQATGESMARERLPEGDKKLYDLLLPRIREVAAGERTGTVFAFTAEDLGLDGVYSARDLELAEDQMLVEEDGRYFISDAAQAAMVAKIHMPGDDLLAALLSDCPRELYWFDKISDGAMSTNVSYGIGGEYDNDRQLTLLRFTEQTAGKFYTISFRVAQDYAQSVEGSDPPMIYVNSVDSKLAKAAAAAAENARSVVAENQDKSDREKLDAYRDYICKAVSYDTFAAQNTDYPYGDPWQLVSVFDGNPDTNVVCEGYAKAFQYLCDLSDFDGPVQCWCVSGTMDTGPEDTPENHMWNVVRLEDGLSYLADVTNCDGDSIGAPDKLFLVKADRGSVAEGYTVDLSESSLVNYRYEERIGGAVAPSRDVALWKDTGVLALAINHRCGENVLWEIDETGTLTVSGTGDMYDYTPGYAPWYSSREKIKSAVIGSGVTYIGDGAFSGCSNLSSVSISETVESMGHAVFAGCESLTAFTVKEGNGAFSVDGNGVLFFEDTILVRCPVNLSGYYQVPGSVQVVWDNAFDSCGGLKTVELPYSVKQLGDGVFENCAALERVYYLCPRNEWEPSAAQSLGELENRGVAVHALIEIAMDTGGGTILPISFLALEGMPYDLLTNREGVNFSFALPVFTPLSREGDVFLGWYTAADGGRRVRDGDLADRNVTTLYAHWTKARSLAVSSAYAGLKAAVGQEGADFALTLQWEGDAPEGLSVLAAAYDPINGRLVGVTPLRITGNGSNERIFSGSLPENQWRWALFAAGSGFNPVMERCDLTTPAPAE